MAEKRVANEGVERDVQQGTARVWGQIEIKVNLGDYNSATISTGHSRDCRDNSKAILTMQKRIADQNEAVIQTALENLEALRDGLGQ
jgi:hypothetical protein